MLLFLYVINVINQKILKSVEHHL